MRSTTLKFWTWIALGLSLLGFLDSSYLAASHYVSGPPPCFIVTGCDKVLQSKYASVAGVPVAVLGVIYYLSLFFLFVVYLDLGKENLLVFVSRMTIIGILVTALLLYLQLFVIKALCIYCLVSAFASLSLFFVSQNIVKLTKHIKT